MKRAILDESLSARLVSERALRYTTSAPPELERPDHVRAASAIAFRGDTLFVFQDDALFLGVVAGDRVDAMPMPGVNAQRRFEDARGNRLDKPDFEACVVEGDLVGFGSGSLPEREWLFLQNATGDQTMVRAPSFYAALRAAVGEINLEGAAIVGDELWLFHRGNTSERDEPAVAKIARAELALAIGDHAPTRIEVERYDLGRLAGVRLGFTDATSRDGRVLIACAAEASDDAIVDGAVLGSRIGVIDGEVVRCANVIGRDGSPIKLEGLALDPTRRNTAWITIDADDVAVPARLCEVTLEGNWAI